jgi:DNA-binding beta-propeller fold protein YncE
MVAFAAVAVVSAQSLSVGIQPGSTRPMEPAVKHASAAGPPLLGFAAGPEPAELRAIVGKINSPQWGAQMLVPEDAKRLYLSPRQLFALVEKTTNAPLELWVLHAAPAEMKQVGLVIAGAMPHPDLVAFSPKGRSSVLYSQSGGSLQIVSNLPAQPSIERQLSLSRLGTPSQIAVSDDAKLVVAAFADGRVMSSLSGAEWVASPIAFTPHAWTFLPDTHDLAVSDTTQKMLVLLPKFPDSSASPRVLLQNIQAQRLTVTKGGEQLVAADLAAKQIWMLDVKTGTVSEKLQAASVDTLSSMRDGFTFLLATSPAVSVLRVRLND